MRESDCQVTPATSAYGLQDAEHTAKRCIEILVQTVDGEIELHAHTVRKLRRIEAERDELRRIEVERDELREREKKYERFLNDERYELQAWVRDLEAKLGRAAQTVVEYQGMVRELKAQDDRWLPADYPPEADGLVIVQDDSGDVDVANWVWVDDKWDCLLDVTYWQPLPRPRLPNTGTSPKEPEELQESDYPPGCEGCEGDEGGRRCEDCDDLPTLQAPRDDATFASITLEWSRGLTSKQDAPSGDSAVAFDAFVARLNLWMTTSLAKARSELHGEPDPCDNCPDNAEDSFACDGCDIVLKENPRELSELPPPEYESMDPQPIPVGKGWRWEYAPGGLFNFKGERVQPLYGDGKLGEVTGGRALVRLWAWVKEDGLVGVMMPQPVKTGVTYALPKGRNVCGQIDDGPGGVHLIIRAWIDDLKREGYMPSRATEARCFWFFEGKGEPEEEAPGDSPQIDPDHPALVRWREIMEDPRDHPLLEVGASVTRLATQLSPGGELVSLKIARAERSCVIPRGSSAIGWLSISPKIRQKLGLEPWKRGTGA